MNSPATITSAPRVARPTARRLPMASSAKVEIPSKPRNESTATDSAEKVNPMENWLGW
jgi:hypothetical protein